MRLLVWSFSRRWVSVLNVRKAGNVMRRLIVCSLSILVARLTQWWLQGGIVVRLIHM